jgi:hypothetical protein
MSFLTGTNTEVIAASGLASPAKATFTTFIPIEQGSSAAYLPIGFFNTNSLAKTIKVVADGIYSTTPTPTIQLGVAANTTLGTMNGTPLTWSTAVWTTAGTAASWAWHFDIELTVQNFTEAAQSSTGTTANIVGLGWAFFSASTVAATTTVTPLSMGSATAVALNAFSAQFIEIGAAWGTSSGSNSVQLLRSTIYGCN